MTGKPSQTDCGAPTIFACRERGKWCADCCPVGHVRNAKEEGRWIEPQKSTKPMRAKT